MKSDVMVSVICNAFNHEPYIADALESFVNQQTSFPFEVIVHDDASTDETACIIRKYAEIYPDIIKPIFETENQYSKWVSISFSIDLPAAKGKYIAFCEGDDFWTDPHKLQKQVDLMESDPSVSMCCHAHRRIQADSKKEIEILRSVTKADGFIDHRDLLSENNFPHMTSILVRREDYANMPADFRGLPVGDYPLRAYMLSLGRVYYFDEVMSSYRVMSQSSWSKTFRFNMDYRYRANKAMDGFLEFYDGYTNLKYHDYIQELILRKDFGTAIFTGRYAEAKASPLYASCGGSKKLLIGIGLRFPKLAMTLGQCYSTIKNKLHP